MNNVSPQKYFKMCILNTLKKKRNYLLRKLDNLKKSKEIEIKENPNILNVWFNILQASNDLELEQKFEGALTSSNTLGNLDQSCPDQYIGTGERQYSLGEFCETPPVFSKMTGSEKFRDRIPANPVKPKTIILILESPHTEEFDEKTKKSHGPAWGATGTAISTFLLMLLGEKYKSYHLLLMNAIQFQCSLGIDTMIFRDHVFREVWNGDCGIAANGPGKEDFTERLKTGKEDFTERLKNYLGTNSSDDILIINSCTTGNDKKNSLYTLVEKAIKEVLNVLKDSETKYWRINHPSSWHFSKFHVTKDSTPK